MVGAPGGEHRERTVPYCCGGVNATEKKYKCLLPSETFHAARLTLIQHQSFTILQISLINSAHLQV